jgi:predicted PurR-regulated permease PerM
MQRQLTGRLEYSWVLIGLGLLMLVGYVVYTFIGTVVFGLFLYYATRPVYRRLRRVVRPRGLAAAVALLALALPALVIVAWAIALVVSEANRVFADGDSLAAVLPPDLVAFVTTGLPETVTTLQWDQLTTADLQTLVDSAASVGEILTTVGVGLVHLFIMIALAYYLLRDGTRLSRWVRFRFGDNRGVLDAVMDAIDTDLHSIFFGNILNAVITGTIGVFAYSLLNSIATPTVAIPAAALVGLLAGVASLIPIVGMKLVYLPVAAYLIAQAVLADPGGLWFPVAFILVSFVIVDTIPDIVLRPYVSGRTLHVGAVMLAYTLGPLLFGWYGLFLMPILLVLVVNFGRHVLPALVHREMVRPYGVDPGATGRPVDTDLTSPGLRVTDEPPRDS